MTDYDVLTEGWIPVKEINGGVKKIGIREALADAPSFEKIVEVSPLKEYAVYRLLITFIMDIFRPEDEEDIATWWEDGCFDEKTIDAYFETCRQEGVSFNLFDREHPFLQTAPDAKEDKGGEKSVANLEMTWPSGNNHTQFSHQLESGCVQKPEEFLKNLCVTYTFAQSGGRGFKPGPNGTPPEYDLIFGKNLFEILLFNTVSKVFFGDLEAKDGQVFWRREKNITNTQDAEGYTWLGGMYYPSRRIRFIPEMKEEEMVHKVIYKPGAYCQQGMIWVDPHVPRIWNKKGNMFVNIRPSEKMEESNWQNIDKYLKEDDFHKLPLNIRQYEIMDLEGEPKVHLVMYGLSTNKAARYNYVRREFTPPLIIMKSEIRSKMVREGVQFAEKVAYYLGVAIGQAMGSEEEKGFVHEWKAAFNMECAQFFESFIHDVEVCDEKKSDITKAVLVKWRKEIKKLGLNIFQRACEGFTKDSVELARVERAKKRLMMIAVESKKDKKQEGSETDGNRRMGG